MKRMTFTDLRLDWLMERGPWLSPPAILLLSAVLLAVAAIADWLVGHISLGVLYMLPMMLAALVLEPLELAGLALFSAFLRSRFDYPGSGIEIALRFAFASVSYFTCGLFVAALVSNRKLVKEHLGKLQREQALRKEAEDQLRLLVASSPAAILTLNEHGTVLAANKAADGLFAIPDNQSMRGRGIEKYLPVLADALDLKNAPEGFRTAAQCTGYRSNGEIFQAHTWFSSYHAPEGTRLAAIVVDSSEEMRDREEQNLRQLVKSNRIVASVVSHELRNLCGAISLLCSHLNEKHALAGDEDFLGILSLVKGLERVALLELHSQEAGRGDVEHIPLRQVLDQLRIVIESEWKEIGGSVRWRLPEGNPLVVADPPGLLQAFLNLANNSHRAVQKASRRELEIAVLLEGESVVIQFQDSGPGIESPERLFQPFQTGADGTGLGLFLSRAVVRSYGGDLQFEPNVSRSCFVIKLQKV